MKKRNDFDIRLATSIAFVVAMILWGKYGNLKMLIRLYAETALPLALFIFSMYALIQIGSKNIGKSLIIVALFAISALVYFDVLQLSKEITIAYPVIAILIIYWLIAPFSRKESEGN